MNTINTISTEDLLAEVARREAFAATIHTPAEFAAALAEKFGSPVYADRPGRRFTRIVNGEVGNGRYVHCFVENATGSVFKSAGWTSPAHKATARYATMDAALEAADPYGSYLYAR